MQAYAERLAGGLSVVRTVASTVRWAGEVYWRWITGYLDPMGAAYGTGMAAASLLFFLYSVLV
jgi:hypothetical protein